MDFFHSDLFVYSYQVVTLVILEGLLSADNALVLAVMVKHLPPEQRAKALRYGIFGAFFFRFLGVVLASYLKKLWYLQAIGAAYLLFIGAGHFIKKSAHEPSETDEAKASVKGAGFWQTVFAVELTDIAFSVDSILAAVAISQNIYIIYLGGILGIITMRFVAGYFIRMLEKFPMLETSAYLLVTWIGVKLSFQSYDFYIDPDHTHHTLPGWLFWSVMAVLFFGAFLYKPKRKNAQKD